MVGIWQLNPSTDDTRGLAAGRSRWTCDSPAYDMDGIDPDGKRPRLGSYSGPPSHALSHRMQHQQPPPEPPSHTYSNHALPPPPAYNQPPPPSPYHDPPPEHRGQPEPPPQGYAHPAYTTSARDARQQYPGDSGYPRSGSFSAPPRSPNDASQLTQLRPLGMAGAHEGPYYPPQYHGEHQGPPPPPGYHPHETQQLNGTAPHGMPIAGHHDPLQVPPLPPGPGANYASSPVTAGPTHLGGGLSYGGPFMGGYNPQRKKQVRATQACDACRNRKAKCDEGRPSCSFCRENSQACVYREVQPQKADRTAQMIIDELRDLKGGLAGVTHMQGEFRQILDSVREEMKVFRQERAKPGDNWRGSLTFDNGPGVSDEREDVKPARSAIEQNERKVPLREVQQQQRAPQQMQPLSRTGSWEEDDRRPEAMVGEVVPEVVGDVGELSIPIEHTTAAQKLLRWPSIQELFSRNQTSYNENYVMALEETRGLLRIYGRGEGFDMGDGGQPGPASPAPSATSVKSEDQAFSPSTPPEGLWGTGFGSPNSGDTKRAVHEGIGGLNPEGTPKIDPQTCVRLLKSYMENLHILHPFLDKNRLTRMVDRFAKRYNPSESPSIRSPFVTSNSIVPGDIRRDSAATLNKAIKRKHSTSTASGPPTDSSSGGGSSSSGTVYKPLLERSISTALVLLVLALGKICEWRDPLPGLVPDGTQHFRQQPHNTYSPLSMQLDSPLPGPMRQSPTTSQSSIYRNVTSPSTGLRFGRMSRRSSNEGLSSFEKGLKNADVIPGLAYYAYATDILGNLHGGNDLTHIQANLLAGLYAGQLARVFESWTWINSACRACQVLVRPGKLNMEASDSYTDLVKFTFWTCLQLESDILAELDLPASGITRYEHIYSTNLPKGVTLGDWTDPQQNEMMIYYSAQVQLRVILNRVHSLLYQMEKTNPKHAGWSTRWCRELDHQLESWRSILPAEYQWSDTDRPSSDINAARMRAKYYGARYLIHRPFLHHALHPLSHQNIQNSQLSESPSTLSAQASHHTTVAETPTTAHQSIRQNNRVGPRRLINIERMDKQVLQASEICVKAAIQSTIAFDGVHKRPIVTNIFGTAHAQFGNVLVLAATYRAGLVQLVSQETLEMLLTRTIDNLSRLQPISPSLAKDAEILQSVQKFLFFEATDSFSSTDS